MAQREQEHTMKQSSGTIIPEVGIHGTDSFVAITPSDVTVLSGIRGIYVGGAGNLVVQNAAGQTVTFTGVPAGTRVF
jgi:hypothetical protein